MYCIVPALFTNKGAHNGAPVSSDAHSSIPLGAQLRIIEATRHGILLDYLESSIALASLKRIRQINAKMCRTWSSMS